MAHAVQEALAKDEHLLVQAGTGTGKSLAYLIPAVMHAVRRPASRLSSRPRPSRCRPRSSTVTCRAWPRPSRRFSAVARPTGWSRVDATTCAPTSSRAASPTTRTACSGRARSTSRRRRLGAGGGPAAGVGRDHRVRRPRRARARGERARVAAGVGQRPRVHGQQVPGGRRLLRRALARGGQGVSTSSSPTTRSWRSTPSRAARCSPSTTCSSSTRRTSWSTGSPRRSPTRSPPPWSSAAAKRAGRLAESTEAVEDAGGLPAGRARRPARGAADRHPRRARRSRSPECATPPGRCSPSSSPPRARSRTAPAGGPGRDRRGPREQRPCPRAARARRRVGRAATCAAAPSCASRP